MQPDTEEYHPYVEDFDLTEEQKVELIRAVWAISKGCFECTFGLDTVPLSRPLQKVGAYLSEEERRLGPATAGAQIRSSIGQQPALNPFLVASSSLSALPARSVAGKRQGGDQENKMFYAHSRPQNTHLRLTSITLGCIMGNVLLLAAGASCAAVNYQKDIS